MIAVTGATGQLGRIVLNKLKRDVSIANIVALVRDPNKASGIGVETRTANYDEPDGLAAALKRVDTLLLISSSEVGRRVTQHHNVIRAARDAGVQRVVYTSVLHAESSPLALADEHRATEAELLESGLEVAILRNGWYAENYADGIRAAVASGTLYGCAGEGRISAASRLDYAEAAATVVHNRSRNNGLYELASDTSWTMSELAAEISRQIGKPVRYVNMSETDYAQALRHKGLPNPIACAVAGYDTAASVGALFDNTSQLSKLIGRQTISLPEMVAAALHQTDRGL